jgi:hypothetical protein
MIALLTLLSACGGKPSDTGEPTGPPTGTASVEIPGDGVDEDGDGWFDEYGVGAREDQLPLFEGPYHAIAEGTVDEEGWLIAATSGTREFLAPFPGVYVWEQGVYGFPYILGAPATDTRFASAMAGLDHFFAVTPLAADPDLAIAFYTLPPSVPIGEFDDVDGTGLGIALRAADVDASGDPALLAGDGTNARLLFPPWTSPSSPGRWIGAGKELGDTADFDGDGANDVSLGDGTSAWVVPGSVVGSAQVAEVGVQISPDSGYTATGAGFAAGDVNGDGYQDLAIPGTGDPDDRGAIWLLAGPVDGNRSAADALATVAGTYPGEHCSTVASAYGDRVAVGCPGDAHLPGRMGLFGFNVLSGQVTMEDAEDSWVGDDRGSELGSALAGGFDVTGDGRRDVAALGDDMFLIPGVP